MFDAWRSWKPPKGTANRVHQIQTISTEEKSTEVGNNSLSILSCPSTFQKNFLSASVHGKWANVKMWWGTSPELLDASIQGLLPGLWAPPRRTDPFGNPMPLFGTVGAAFLKNSDLADFRPRNYFKTNRIKGNIQSCIKCEVGIGTVQVIVYWKEKDYWPPKTHSNRWDLFANWNEEWEWVWQGLPEARLRSSVGHEMGHHESSLRMLLPCHFFYSCMKCHVWQWHTAMRSRSILTHLYLDQEPQMRFFTSWLLQQLISRMTTAWEKTFCEKGGK